MPGDWIEDSSEDESAMYITQSSNSTRSTIIEGDDILFFIRPYFSQLPEAFLLFFPLGEKRFGRPIPSSECEKLEESWIS